MAERKPFTLRERRRWTQGFGHRPVNNWGDGDLPAPWCPGDVVVLVEPLPDDDDGYNRLRGQVGPHFVVTCGFSIDEGDEWYFRVYDGNGEFGSDRMHVAYDWPEPVEYMRCFRLVETPDPEGLALRERMIADGWSWTAHPRCEACGQEIRDG